MRVPKPDFQEIVMFLVPLSLRASNSGRRPALDVAESERQYTVTLDLPGVAKNDVKVAIDGKHVSVAAQASAQSEQKDGDRIVYRERAAASFSRSFTLPEDIDQDGSSAKLDNGVLTLALAKRRANAAKQLAIN